MLTNPKATLMRIWLDNGEYVDVTPDHRMMLRDGTFIPAANLKENDSLMPYYQRIKDGRKYVLDNSTGKFVAQYHLVSAKKGEPAEVGYNIHHKDGIKINDDFDNLIKLSGLEPNVDIEIKCTGLRPGEKLYEERLMDEEGMQKTPNGLINIANPIQLDEEKLWKSLDELYAAAYAETSEMKMLISQLVPTYKITENKAENSAENSAQ